MKIIFTDHFFQDGFSKFLYSAILDRGRDFLHNLLCRELQTKAKQSHLSISLLFFFKIKLTVFSSLVLFFESLPGKRIRTSLTTAGKITSTTSARPSAPRKWMSILKTKR